MDLRSYDPASRQHGLLTSRQAQAAGLTPPMVAQLVRSGAWVRLRRGVYLDAGQWQQAHPYDVQPLLRVRAAGLVLQTAHVFSHDSASLAHGLGAPDPRASWVHVTREGVRGTRKIAGVKHHGAPYHSSQVQHVDGLVVLDLARTALDMVREHGLRGGLPACDAALRRGVTRSQLRQAASVMACWPGRRAITRAIELADPGAESWLESTARLLVTELGVGTPETQFGLSDGHRTAWCDLRVGRHVIEVDGRVKYDGTLDPRSAEQVVWAEKRRQDFITGFKLGMSRLTHHDLTSGWDQARRRVHREYAATVARYGTDLGDLAPYIIRRPRL
ncbi:type IV toxin-antitoxin system AbiEi family antitoxin domain-containing protein [Nocardioides campestrisoli]|uniref:type IV toxin-antitoxin system AbiEi family antitoxin domain-containing protein n=1 Tax=Nocardioides campestrisoli TaxID=2736757 RepID=UPI00163DA31C|nr:type IV toxin-antitoxin system AbiEi family antitoxin domain-containing protein [Nocardioides campestrisoli]